MSLLLHHQNWKTSPIITTIITTVIITITILLLLCCSLLLFLLQRVSLLTIWLAFELVAGQEASPVLSTRAGHWCRNWLWKEEDFNARPCVAMGLFWNVLTLYEVWDRTPRTHDTHRKMFILGPHCYMSSLIYGFSLAWAWGASACEEKHCRSFFLRSWVRRVIDGSRACERRFVGFQKRLGTWDWNTNWTMKANEGCRYMIEYSHQ